MKIILMFLCSLSIISCMGDMVVQEQSKTSFIGETPNVELEIVPSHYGQGHTLDDYFMITGTYSGFEAGSNNSFELEVLDAYDCAYTLEHDGITISNGRFDGHYLPVQPGKWKLRAKIRDANPPYDCFYSNEVEIEILLPSYDQLLLENTIKEKFDELWERTKDAEKNKEKREYGCVINLKTYGGRQRPEYKLLEEEGAIDNSCELNMQNHINFEIKDEYSLYPHTGGSFCVAIFHTHPPMTNCSSDRIRALGPSSDDRSEADTKRMLSIVADYGTYGTLKGGHDRDKPYELSYAWGIRREWSK